VFFHVQVVEFTIAPGRDIIEDHQRAGSKQSHLTDPFLRLSAQLVGTEERLVVARFMVLESPLSSGTSAASVSGGRAGSAASCRYHATSPELSLAPPEHPTNYETGSLNQFQKWLGGLMFAQ